MIVLQYLKNEDCNTIICLLNVYVKYLKYAPKTEQSINFKTVSELLAIIFSYQENEIAIPKEAANVLCCAILYYMMCPERNRTKDEYLKGMAINIINKIKKA